ncbi:FGGY-family carbohydrate kinase [Albibacterium profundi]|uniref:FGGY family carbohydrate kinase n=1 Tax=Albibacterium profundi TaxID=3134906 RepID=A0ABV5CKE9_9SPHI
MEKNSVIAVFDVGKTNKKLFLFDRHYKIVYEKSARFLETTDEDGFPCENLDSLRLSVFDSLDEVSRKTDFDIKAINFSTYGASFVYLDEKGDTVTPLYNYLKPYPEDIQREFYRRYGGEERFASQTASPVLGSLNVGMQLYRIKREQPERFKRIKAALHLPQYMSYLISGRLYSDITSIGCHTNLWDFEANDYHPWVENEGILDKLAPIVPSDMVYSSQLPDITALVGVGLHDSSASLIPYLVGFNQPFVLISTGTWSISLNPFNTTRLTELELKSDCLSYIQYQGTPVKASRLFAGHEHEKQVERIANYFNQATSKYRNMIFDPSILKLDNRRELRKSFSDQELGVFASDVEAYHYLILHLVNEQKRSTELIIKGSDVKRIFVDGGFSKNSIYMNLLAAAFPDIEVFAASMAQATAIGTALSIHHSWNSDPIPNDLIELKFYSPSIVL